MRIGEELDGAVLFSCDDRSVYDLSAHLEDLSKHFRIPFPDHSILAQGQDKAEAWRTCLRAGVPTPQTHQPDPEEVEKLAESLEYPVLVKPRLTLGFIPQHARKLYVCHGPDELVADYAKVHATHPDPLIQERIPGGDDSVYQIMVLLNQDQDLVGSFCFRKLAQWPVGFGIGCLCVSLHLPVLLEQSLRFLKEIDWFGLASVEYKYDERDGLYKLIDVNTRFCGETNMAMAAGLNFPLALYRLARGEEATLGEYGDGVYWAELYNTLRNLRFRLRQRSYSGIAGDLLRSTDPRTTHSILSLRDPGPAALWAERMISRVIAGFTRH